MSNNDSIPILLPFDDVWDSCLTRPFQFETVLNASDVHHLESLREVSLARRLGIEERGDGKDVDGQIKRIEEYRFFLADLMTKIDDYKKKDMEKKLGFEWTSPLGMQDKFYYKLKGLELEMSMVLLLYGCALRKKGQLAAAQLLNSGMDGAADVAKIFRQAAGVFSYLGRVLLPTFEADLPADRPAELVSAMAICFEHISLGESQSIIALRGESKGTSPSVVAALHVAASDLYEKAAKVLRENTGSFNQISDRLKRYMAVSSSLHIGRAHQAIAKDRVENGQAGEAVAACQNARAHVRDCLAVIEGDLQWVGTVNAENGRLKNLENHCDEQRRCVYYQGVAQIPPDLVPGKVLAKVLEFQPRQGSSIL